MLDDGQSVLATASEINGMFYLDIPLNAPKCVSSLLFIDSISGNCNCYCVIQETSSHQDTESESLEKNVPAENSSTLRTAVSIKAVHIPFTGLDTFHWKKRGSLQQVIGSSFWSNGVHANYFWSRPKYSGDSK